MKEKHNVEFKEKWRDDFLKTIAAFANTDGGVLYIGKTDNGKVIGVINSKKLLEDIPNKIKNKLSIVSDVREIEISGKSIIEVEVNKSNTAVSYNGIYYYRSGSTTQKIEGGNNLLQFLIEKTGKTWDLEVIDILTVADFERDSFKIFKRLAIENKRMDEEDFDGNDVHILEKLDLIRNGKLTKAAIMLFYENPDIIAPESYIKIGKFNDEHEIEYMDEIHGSLIQQADKVIDLLYLKYLKVNITYKGDVRVETFPFERSAVREAVFNAIIHKNYASQNPIQIKVYDEKLLISNDCRLPLGWTDKNIINDHQSRRNNPAIANAFYRAGLVESWGRGIEKIFDKCRKEGVPKPKFIVHPEDIMVIFKANKKNRKLDKSASSISLLDEIDISIINAIKIDPSLSYRLLSEKVGISAPAIQKRMRKMLEKEILKRIGTNQKGEWTINVDI
ncbi:ATP-binding protein [Breznakia pachnodae]|uniref:ATP-dependent DNA helicase RecG n=1 Tax=Breznakia pachnodae TaxID=265178 RepID=A0ABU0E9V9_9FIRM|nr:RNA-binding domain-containing protein [Breznakia pachnodae]MDQ0363290.1 ATP-dependent DNA helicase RecG [Breznakia pachnodae]